MPLHLVMSMLHVLTLWAAMNALVSLVLLEMGLHLDQDVLVSLLHWVCNQILSCS